MGTVMLFARCCGAETFWRRWRYQGVRCRWRRCWGEQRARFPAFAHRHRPNRMLPGAPDLSGATAVLGIRCSERRGTRRATAEQVARDMPDPLPTTERSMTISLCTPQQRAVDGLSRLLPRGNLLLLQSGNGQGRSTVLAELHRAHGGTLLGMHDFFQALHGRHPQALEETFEQVVRDALSANDAVFVDDLHLL